MMKISAALTQLLIVGALVFFSGSAVSQQPYPNKPIRFIIPFAPGGSTSILARLVGERLSESWGQQVLVDNRPGGNTVIGTEALVRSPPDGYSILLITTSHVTYPLLLPTPYDPIKDFAAVATLGISEYMLALNPSVPANNLQEFIAYAKSKPGQLNFSTAGSGGLDYLAGELFNILAGVKMQHVPYKGAAPAITDLVGGQVQLSFALPINVLNFVKAGKIKAIAISGKIRMEAVPQMPTFAEAGMPSFEISVWFGLLAPAGTPKEIIDKLSTEIAKIIAIPDVKEKLASLGMNPFTSTPEQFTSLIKADSAKYAKVIKAANIKRD